MRSTIRFQGLLWAIAVAIGCGTTHSDPGNGGAPPSDAASPRDAETPPVKVDSGPHEAGANDAAVKDAGPAPLDASSCVPIELRTVFILDRQGQQRQVLGGRGSSFDRTTWELEGRVTSHGFGFPEDDAPEFFTRPAPEKKLSYLRVTAADERLWTIVVSDLPSFGVRDGAPVRARFSYEWGGWSPENVALTLSVDGEVALHYAAAGPVQDLATPDGWRIEQDKSICQRNDVCGSWANYAVSIRSPDDQQSALAGAETIQIAGYNVAGVSSQQLPSPSSGCSDWYVSASELLLARSAPLGDAEWTCRPKQQSTLSGVEIRFAETGPCRFSLSQARAGISIPYRVVVAADVAGVRSLAQDAGGCSVKPAGELSLLERLSGNGQVYGLLDIGGCGGSQLGPAGTLRSGNYSYEFKWDGLNWYGPSDTGEPKRAPFPAGVYTLRVSAKGGVGADDDAGTGTPFEVTGGLDILLSD